MIIKNRVVHLHLLWQKRYLLSIIFNIVGHECRDGLDLEKIRRNWYGQYGHSGIVTLPSKGLLDGETV